VLKNIYNDCLYVEYYNFPDGVSLSKIPSLVGRQPDVIRVEQQVYRLPNSSVNAWTGLDARFSENFAVVWKGKLEVAKMGPYEFTLEADTGARLRINDKLIVESPNSTTTTLHSGQHNIRLEFFSKNALSKMIQLHYNSDVQQEPGRHPYDRDGAYFTHYVAVNLKSSSCGAEEHL